MFGLSHTTAYAIRAMAHLEGDGGAWRLARDVAQEIGAPVPYLAKVLNQLSRARLLLAKRGYRGGFRLARPAAEISIAEIAAAIGGTEWLSDCLLGLGKCSEQRHCPSHAFWKVGREHIAQHLDAMSLADFAVHELARPQPNGSAA